MIRETLDADCPNCQRLRQRNHSIAAAKDREMAEWQSEAMRYRHYFAEARKRVGHWLADWTSDPPAQEEGGWWRYTSENHRTEVAALVREIHEAREERDRLRLIVQELA
jgi:hypothetical protein